MSALPPKADNQTCSEQSKIMDCAERMTKRTHRPECQSRDHRIPRSPRSAGLAGKATSSPLQHCRALLCQPSKRPAPRPCGHPAKLLTGPYRIACRCKLRLQVKRYWAVLEALRQFVHQEIRRLFRRIRCGEMYEVLGHQLITDRLPRARLVDEHESIHAIVLFVGKAIGRGQAAKGRGHGRMARRELIEFCRLGSIWWARGQRQQQIAKVFAGGYRKELE